MVVGGGLRHLVAAGVAVRGADSPKSSPVAITMAEAIGERHPGGQRRGAQPEEGASACNRQWRG